MYYSFRRRLLPYHPCWFDWSCTRHSAPCGTRSLAQAKQKPHKKKNEEEDEMNCRPLECVYFINDLFHENSVCILLCLSRAWARNPVLSPISFVLLHSSDKFLLSPVIRTSFCIFFSENEREQTFETKRNPGPHRGPLTLQWHKEIHAKWK